MLNSLASRMLSVFLPLVLLAELVVFGVQSWAFYEEQRRELLNRLDELVTVQSAALAAPLWEFDTVAIEASVAEIAKLNYVRGIIVYDEAGEVLLRQGDLDVGPEAPDYVRSAEIIYSDQSGQQVIGSLTISVTGTQIRESLTREAWLNAAILLALLIALIGSAMIATRKFVGAPLRLLQGAIETRQAGGEMAPISWKSEDELGVVVHAFNRMQASEAESHRKIRDYQAHLEDLVEERTAEIRSSIEYASRIQRATLPTNVMMNEVFAAHFAIWEPRDLVGGDIYWVRRWGDGHLVMLGDCTGHGVPGALMTLVCTGVLDRAESETAPGDLAMLVQRVHQLIKAALAQNGGPGNGDLGNSAGQTDDGLDLAVCYIPKSRDSLTFVGANIDLYIARGPEIERIRGMKKGIGYPEVPDAQAFQSHDILLRGDETFYISSDGMIDQVGGETKAMFGRKRFQRLLADAVSEPMAVQKKMITDRLTAYQGVEARRDDVSVIAFHF